MNTNEFKEFILENPTIVTPLFNTTNIAKSHTKGTFGTPLEIAAIIALLPLVSYVVNNIGLPWLYEAKRYSELWRTRFHKWVDNQHNQHDLDPSTLKTQGDALREELEKVTEKSAQKIWERLAELMKKEMPTDKTKPQ